jgi:hypothetical protein
MKPVRHYVVGRELDEDETTLRPSVVGPFFGRRSADRLCDGQGRDAKAHPELVGTSQVVTAAELKKMRGE